MTEQNEQNENQESTGTQKAGALVGAAKVLEDGVALVGEKAPIVASVVYHKVKKGLSAAYGTSSTLVRDAYHTASVYADKHKHRTEIKRLKGRRESACAELGSTIYARLVVNEETPEGLVKDPDILSRFKEIQQLDDEIVLVGKELEDD